MSNGCTKTKAPTALIVSALIKSLAYAPKSIFVATDANAKYKLKLIREITLDSKKPLYIAAKSMVRINQLLSSALKALRQVLIPKKG